MSEEIKKKMLMVSTILYKSNVPIEEAKIIGHFIEQLQQENQQLKDDYSNLLETSKAYKKLLKTTMEKEHNAIKVLDEIREYIEKDYSFAKRHDIPLLTKDEQLAGKLFEILDKAGSNE